jgi:hypothetical protein
MEGRPCRLNTATSFLPGNVVKLGGIVMRDIRSDLQERADFIENQIGAASAHFEKMVQQLQSERDARVADLKGALAMINKLMEFEHGLVGNVVANSPAPHLSLADRIKAAGG